MWNRPTNLDILGSECLEQLSPIADNLTWHVRLKTLLNGRLHSMTIDEAYPLYFWIVNIWGGIQRFRDDAEGKNRARIRRFLAELPTNVLSADSFSVISSLSKIASYREIDNHLIYDSRVAQTLNWLLLRYGSGQRLYFPMPPGRNAVVSRFEISTLIRFMEIGLTVRKKSDGRQFRSKKSAYHQYCKLIRDMTPLVFDGPEAQHPYYLEMLLFAVADEEVFEDMKNGVTVTIQPPVAKTP